MKNIIFIAPPAAGKGTQSDILVKKFGYEHISTGDILREEISNQSELGEKVKNIIENGELVTDDIMISLIQNKLSMLDGKPFILDGFPRTLNQSIALDEILNMQNIKYNVIYLKLDGDIAKKRILGRYVCSCGKSYNIYFEDLKPKCDGICDKCGSKLIKRSDDNEESFDVRYNTFIKNNEPIIKYYEDKKILNTVDVNTDVDTIASNIEKVINDNN